MNNVKILLLLALTWANISADTVDTLRVETREGRKIMHDGFLMEWSLKTAIPWGSDSAWLGEAVATPEGLAGYLRSYSAEPCSAGALVFSASFFEPIRVNLPPDSGWRSEVIKIDQTTSATAAVYTIEWLFPWPAGYDRMTTPFSVVMEEQCGEDHRLPVLVFNYRYKKEKSNQAGALIGRILLIGGLGLMYLMVQRKIRNQTLQRGSPHQSA